MKKYLSLMAFAMMAVFSLTFVSCGDNDEEKDKYGLININGENYLCWDYNSPFSLYSRWTNGNLIICFPFFPMVKFGDETRYPYVYYIECNGINKPVKDINLADYPNINIKISLNADLYLFAVYESGSAIVKSVSDDDHITMEFKNFKCKTESNSYTLNGTIKLRYDVELRYDVD